jgi:KDO2-lipid IV(A) lauroyltransferase
MIFISTLVPRTWWLAFFGWMGKMSYGIATRTRDQIVFHLGMAYGKEMSTREVVTLTKRVFRMLGKNAGDVLRSSRISSLADLNKFLVTEGMENFERAAARGRGVIFLTCHLGAFDLQITNMALRGLKPNIIGTALQDERLNDLLWKYRNAYGAIAIERGKETLRLFKALKLGGSIAILIDQDTKVKSRFVNFFGMPAATPVGAAILAMKTGAAVIPTYIFLGEDNLQHMHVLPEIELVSTGDDEKDMIANTQHYTDFIERVIREHPEQWVWMHERWKTRPGEEVR